MRCTAIADDSKEEFMKTNKKQRIETLVLGAILTALVILLQVLGAFIRFGPFSVSLVLLPIVIGASVGGPWLGAWLGTVFGAAVLISGDAAVFFAIDPVGTVVTVLAKGLLCGLCAGVVYAALGKLKVNRYGKVLASALICPVVNTGVFLLGCLCFFMDTIKVWAGDTNVVQYMFLGLVGANFLVEVGVNLILCPIVVRLLNIRKQPK